MFSFLTFLQPIKTKYSLQTEAKKREKTFFALLKTSQISYAIYTKYYKEI